MHDTWLTTTEARAAYFPELCRKAVWARIKKYAARGFPAVREQTRPGGGIELAVRAVELEAYLGLIPVAA